MKPIFVGLCMSVFLVMLYSASFAQQNITAVPLYVLSGNFDHIYTASEEEVTFHKTHRYGQKIGNGVYLSDDYGSDGTAGYVFDQPAQGTVPLYRYESQMENRGIRHFYTISKQKGDEAVASGYKYIGVCCYVSGKPEKGALPLYRLYRGPIYDNSDPNFPKVEGDDHLYTTDAAYKKKLINLSGYADEGNEGYIWPTVISLPTTDLTRSEQYTQMLSTEGCTRRGSNESCTTEIGYFNCEVARTKGYLKINTCSPPFTHQAYLANDQKLLALNCEHFLGRPGQYLCQNFKGSNECEKYRKQPNSPTTRCVSIPGTAISNDLGKRGCDHLLGRPDEYLCRNDDSYKACENYRMDGEVKKCVSTKPMDPKKKNE